MAVLHFFLSAFLPEREQPQGGAFSSLEREKYFIFQTNLCWLWACYLAERGSSGTEVTVLICFDPFLPECMGTIVWCFCQPLGLKTVRL